MIGRQRNINVSCFADRFSVIQCLDHGEFFRILVNDVGNFAQDRCSLLCRCLLPGGECFPCAFDGVVNVGLGGCRNFRQFFAIGWVVDRDGTTIGSVTESTINIKLICGLKCNHK